MRFEPTRDPDGDRILAAEARDRELEKGSHPSTWLRVPRKCPLCGVKPKEFRGELLCACMLPVIR